MNHLSPSDWTERGRALGHDLYRHGRPHHGEDAPVAVAEGYAAAEGCGSRRFPPADRFVRKWLQLRLGAYRRGRAVEPCVTPELLREIDVAVCPVTRAALTHGERSDTDASIDRLCNDGAYAANNLAVMSVRANRAKGARGFAHVLALSEKDEPTDGLSPVEWLRLAVLMLGPCFTDRARLAPMIPLAAPLAPRSARPGVQMIQHVFTEGAGRAAGRNALVRDFRAACPDERSTHRLQAFADALHAALKGRHVPHDAWLDARVMRAFIEWRAALDERAWAFAGERARRIAGSSPLPRAAIAAWRLATAGYAVPRFFDVVQAPSIGRSNRWATDRLTHRSAALGAAR